MNSSSKQIESFIYARVSSARQLTEGHGNDTQEQICRQYAKGKKFRVLKTYKEPGICGALSKRPAMDSMLTALKERHKRNKETVVIIDDLKRFSRDVGAYLELKSIVLECDAKLASPKFEFQDTPENEFFELILVLQGQLERKQNQRQVIDKMRARMELGYWPFPATPPGLKLVKEKEHGKIMRRNEPAASIVAEALEGFAIGRFRTQCDLQHFIVNKGLYSASPLKPSQARRLLDRSLIYAGYLEYEPWGVVRVKGHHDPLISFETHLRIQELLGNTTSTMVRKDTRPDFPLRGWVVCSNCSVKLTAQWCRGNGGRYPKYWCRNKECHLYGKTIQKIRIEADFEKTLDKAHLQSSLRELSKANLLQKWEEKMSTVETRYKNLKKELATIDKQITPLAIRAAGARSEALSTAYEREIEELENRRIVLEEKIPELAPENYSFRTALEKVDDFLKDPLKQWRKPDLESKHRVLQMCFLGQLEYDRDNGFRTPDYSLTYAFLSGLSQPRVTGSGHGRN